MSNILILDNYSYGKKKLHEIIGTIIPAAVIFQADNFDDGIGILEQRRIDILFLNNTFLEMKEFDMFKHLSYKPITILICDDYQLKSVSQLTKSGAIGYFMRTTFGLQFIENFINDRIEEHPKDETLMLSTALGIYPVRIDSVAAIEITKRNTLTVYTQEKVLKDVRGTLTELMKVLPKDFVPISRQCILDRKAIARIIVKSREVFINIQGEEKKFVCSRERIKDLIEWFDAIKKVF